MKKLIFLFLLIQSNPGLFAQFSFQFSKVAGNKGDIVSVDVSARNFTNIATTEYSVNYDSAILEIVDIANINTSYDVNFQSHIGSSRARNGQLIFSWNAADGNGKNIPDNQRLYSIRFKLIGKECDSSAVQLSSTPAKIEVLNGNLDPVQVTSTDGQAKINGPGCSGTQPGSDLTITAKKETAAKGTVKCIKFCATNFKDINSMQFTIHWDVNVAQYNSFNKVDLVDISAGTVFPLTDNSGVRILWEPASAQPVTLPDGAVIFEICLTATGNAGTMTNITFDGNPIPIEVTNGKGDVIPVTFTPGMLSITAAAKNLRLFSRDTTLRASKGQSYCIPILADDFTCVDAMQFAMKFDNTKVSFKQVNSFNVGCLGAGNFSVKNDTINVVWDKNTCPSQTLSNGSSLFTICFDLLVDCPTTTSISFINLQSGPIEFEDCNGQIFTVSHSPININVQCPNNPTNCTVTQGTSMPTRCFDTMDGKLSGFSVSGGVGPFTYAWRKVGSSTISSTELNPMNMMAGRYILTATDQGNNNATCASAIIEITSPPEIIITDAVITHESCAAGDGMITVKISGGTPDPVSGLYDVAWRRCGSSTVITRNEKLSNRIGGCYSIEVTDSKGCIKRDSFTINKPPLCPATCNVTRPIKCFGDCTGQVFASVYGGTSPYSFSWSNGVNTGTGNPAINLCAGKLTITVTDATGATSTSTCEITQPAKIDIKLDSTKASTGNNGEIYITVTGGVTPYKYEWKNSQNQIVGTTEDIKNLAPGEYNVCVTDKDTCTQCLKITLSSAGQGPKVTLKTDKYAGGTDVSCKDKCDGKIIATADGGSAPYTYSIRPGSGTGPTFTNLCPGSYTVTVTDAAGKSSTETISVANAAGFDVTLKRLSCASNSTGTDGSYQITVGGGAPPYSYRWCNNETGNVNNSLSAGSCAVTITDANGCQETETFTVCIVTAGADCYQGRLVISPNNDGLNDFFVIECTETTNNNLTIFDRWGNQVYRARNYLNTFNGISDEGEELTEGTYMWVLQVIETGKNDVYHKGTVTIVR